MASYILKRLLLMIPTLIGVMLITFIVTQFVPGGPVEQLISQIQGRTLTGEASTGTEGLYRGAQGLSEDLKRQFTRTCKRIYRVLGLSGYARLDFRLASDGTAYFLEANPNPEIAANEEFAAASKAAGMSYDQMLERILRLGLQRAARA